jgi:hypothetical protein
LLLSASKAAFILSYFSSQFEQESAHDETNG